MKQKLTFDLDKLIFGKKYPTSQSFPDLNKSGMKGYSKPYHLSEDLLMGKSQC